ncbi:M23 family metallopeptidase [Mycetocola sp. 2940]|uniref:M23 family metallopeptidase n=1 Tax=Mycetocola sp. 2940 TaxID=3156452 RepID=UPI0033972B99
MIDPSTLLHGTAPASAPARTRRRRGYLRSLLVVGIAVPALAGIVAIPAHGVVTAPAATAVAALEDPLQNAGPASRGGNYMHDADAPWIRPVTAGVTSPYGPRRVICNAVGCSSSFHDGVDFGSACGTAVKAVSPGRVTFAGNAGSFGERVIIDHGSGLASLYGHLQTGSFAVTAGQLVKAGTVIARVGATGVVTGCHLDLKIRTGVYIDPGPFLAARGVIL